MKWKSFTPEEVLALRENPYTLKVTDKTIAFTRAFKEQFWQGIQEGKSKHELLKEMGYDPELLGSSRVEGIRQPLTALREMLWKNYRRRGTQKQIRK